jgi:hypothetical protein
MSAFRVKNLSRAGLIPTPLFELAPDRAIMKHTAEQLNLFEIEAEDSEAIYGADIPFLVVETTLTPTLTMTASGESKVGRRPIPLATPIPSGF